MTGRPTVSASELLLGLNREQREAVTHDLGPLLILAGAGTGKTRVIVRRLAYLVTQRGIAPDRVVLVTFTNRAAAEAARRVADLIAEEGTSALIGTFHYLGHRLLRRYGGRTDFGSNFNVLTPRQSMTILRGVIRSRAEHAAGLPAGDLRDLVRLCRTNGTVSTSPGVKDIANEYVRAMRSSRCLDLDDLIIEAVALLERDSEVRDIVRRRIRHVLVDEYQDVDPMQVRLLQALVGDSGHITAVGDDDQAIYGWRHADARAMLEFERSFPGASLIRLERNYRSTGRILQVANELMRHNSSRLGKTLVASRMAGRRPLVFAAGDETEEAVFVAKQCSLLIDRGLPSGSLAVLFRINAQSRSIEEELVRSQIPYTVRAGQRFYERPEVARIVDGLRVLRSIADLEAWRALLLRLPGVGPATVEHLIAGMREALDEEEQPSSLGPALGNRTGSESIPRGLSEAAARSPQRIRESVRQLVVQVDQLRGHRSLTAQVRGVATSMDWLAGPIGSGAREREESEENVSEFITVASEFEGQRGTLAGFLDRLALAGSDASPRLSNGDQADGGVQLMTLHSAKGLEFDTVFVVGVEEGLLPHRRSQTEDEMQEERRLMYVGMTRARNQLIMSYARVRNSAGTLFTSGPSRFLQEIPPQVVSITHSASPRHTRERLVHAGIGERVRHPRWGVGTINLVEGEGRMTMVSIGFNDGVTRRVQLCHAPLQRVS